MPTTKTLSKESFQQVSKNLLHSTRALERKTFESYFENGDEAAILTELRNYQNSDGGFGHGLEPDFKLPFSSPLATSVAFQHLERVDVKRFGPETAEAGIRYFEDSFDSQRGRWLAVPKEVNDFPHAPWWDFDEAKNTTPIDNSWGNPTAEIISYLLKYECFVESLDIEKILQRAIDKLLQKQEFNSEHEIYCYLKLYKKLPTKWAKKIENQLIRAIDQLLCTDPSQWETYVPQPLDFVTDPQSPRFGISDRLLEENLNVLVKTLRQNGAVAPSWEWGRDQTHWKKAEEEWTDILTLRALIILDKFDRIEN